jgi:hypothetical protein
MADWSNGILRNYSTMVPNTNLVQTVSARRGTPTNTVDGTGIYFDGSDDNYPTAWTSWQLPTFSNCTIVLWANGNTNSAQSYPMMMRDNATLPSDIAIFRGAGGIAGPMRLDINIKATGENYTGASDMKMLVTNRQYMFAGFVTVGTTNTVIQSMQMYGTTQLWTAAKNVNAVFQFTNSAPLSDARIKGIGGLNGTAYWDRNIYYRMLFYRRTLTSNEIVSIYANGSENP